MGSLLLLSFLVGMKHALEADHVAAVASLATRSRSVGETVRMGAAWGLGHTVTLLGFGMVVLFLDTVVPEQLARALELAVGIMLVILGIDVLRRLVTERVHFHAHEHSGDVRHFHAHSHRHEPAHVHRHQHPGPQRLRAFLVGLMHGMAGSAALILLTLGATRSVPQGVASIAVFGVGSTLGMALLSAVISVPLRHSARSLTWAHRGLQGMVGTLTAGLGLAILIRVGG